MRQKFNAFFFAIEFSVFFHIKYFIFSQTQYRLKIYLHIFDFSDKIEQTLDAKNINENLEST